MRRYAILAAVLLAAGCASQPPPAARGFIATAVYIKGGPVNIEVSISQASPWDRVTAVELALPAGGSVFAHRLDTETVTETRTVDPGYGGSAFGIGGGFGVGSGGFVGTGFSFGFPIGGGGVTEEAVISEIRTVARIAIPDAADYRANWRAYKIRITTTGDDGAGDIIVIGPPQP